MRYRGFTLIEMIVVLAIVAILALVAMPNTAPLEARKKVKDALEYTEKLKPNIEAIYLANGYSFPATNKLAGLPDADKLISNDISSITVDDGVLHVLLGNNVYPILKGKTVSIQPLVVKGSASSPIDWRCGLADIPDGMEAVGTNKTDLDNALLPFACRKKNQINN